MSAISFFPHFSSQQTTASRAPSTGRNPSQGGVLSHTRTLPKMHTVYYGVQSAVFLPSNGKDSSSGSASGSYRTVNKVRFNGPQVTQESVGKTYGSTGTKANPNTGRIQPYGNSARYINSATRNNTGTKAGAVISSYSSMSGIGRPSSSTVASTASNTVCIPCGDY